ncbi:MAG: hypothetical protein OES10_02975 [Gammaproteobacteria bacterium]|nr:hypothetical protein [Gammaproteobacteria bacterium]MDH3750696.1 hypothetical protein [Gammaproteobacteria bacterium]
MKIPNVMPKTLLAAVIAALVGGGAGVANATEPCDDFGECKVLVEINSTDGDIGFHFLMDGDDLVRAALKNPAGEKIFQYVVRRELREQTLTETFAESAEPLCFNPEFDDDEENDDEDFVTLTEFIDRWSEGTYTFVGENADGEASYGESELSFNLPAAPRRLKWEEEEDGGDVEGEISWRRGWHLGKCSRGMWRLPMKPKDVPVAIWEVVLEVDVDVEDPELDEEYLAVANAKYVVRIPGDAEELEVEVPDDFLETLPEDTPAKVEVGAIGFDDNATFTEIGDICLNETDDGCEDDE